MITRKKLIEVALPLEGINKASIRESYIYRGNPSAIHKWWTQKPLAAARAVIFAQMVDDPSEHIADLLRDSIKYTQAQQTLAERQAAWNIRRRAFESIPIPGERAVLDPGQAPTLEGCIADNERQRLFRLIEQLMVWENTTNEDVLNQARDEIWKSWRRTCAENADHPHATELFNSERLPPFHDPFAGGATLPLEAQRLGLESNASDLNPVAVLINKVMIEIPPKFAGRPPVNPQSRHGQMALGQQWRGTQGLAADIRYYGQWMRGEAEKRIGYLYPKIEVTATMAKERPDLESYVGKKQTVIAWLWARTVKSPNPAFANVDVPLASTFLLSTKSGKEVYVEPVIDGSSYHFTVNVGKPKDMEAAKNGTKLARGANFRCLMSETPIAGDYIKAEGKAGRLGTRLMAIVVEGEHGRFYLAPTQEHELIAEQARPEWRPELVISGSTQYIGVRPYGMEQFSDLFSNRQLVALTTFCDQVQDLRIMVKRHALESGMENDENSLADGGVAAEAYADVVATYVACSLSKVADYNCSLVPWYTKEDRPGHLFSKQAIPMLWGYTELNPLSNIGGSLVASINIIADALAGCNYECTPAVVTQVDAVKLQTSAMSVFSTDPPYYDNVPFADLSDFFYVWLRRSLRPVFPNLFATLAVPKIEELVAFAYRHNSKTGAEAFFLSGMTNAMQRIAEQAHPAFPITLYYAFKQSESNGDEGISSTGWETFLHALIQVGFTLNATWPMRTERQSRSRGIASNALASSIVLVCRPRSINAPIVTRRDFLAALKDELPVALAHLQYGNIAPVDLAQAAIGPGMAVFTRYDKVLDASGKAIGVREALALINAILDEVLNEQEGDFDTDTRWALAWFEQYGFSEGEYGVAETLSKAKNTSVAGMVTAGIVASRAGKVRLLRPNELPASWDPSLDNRLTVWEMVHHLVRALDQGELAAAKLAAQIGAPAEIARELAYRLYAVCERKKRAVEALAYNGLVQSWPEMMRLAREQHTSDIIQTNLFGGA